MAGTKWEVSTHYHCYLGHTLGLSWASRAFKECQSHSDSAMLESIWEYGWQFSVAFFVCLFPPKQADPFLNRIIKSDFNFLCHLGP